MLVQQVDVVGVEALQRTLHRRANVSPPAVAFRGHLLAIFDQEPELGGKDDLGAPPLERPPRRASLVMPIDIGRIRMPAKTSKRTTQKKPKSKHIYALIQNRILMDDIILISAKGIVSAGIRAGTSSDFSHVAICTTKHVT